MPEQYRYSLPVKAGDQRQLGELTGAACAVEVAEMAERHAGPLVLIAPDMQTALRLHDEIQQFTESLVMNLADWETRRWERGGVDFGGRAGGSIRGKGAEGSLFVSCIGGTVFFGTPSSAWPYSFRFERVRAGRSVKAMSGVCIHIIETKTR